jgi:hypothetical protein
VVGRIEVDAVEVEDLGHDDAAAGSEFEGDREGVAAGENDDLS